jgi:hypothetical protein
VPLKRRVQLLPAKLDLNHQLSDGGDRAVKVRLSAAPRRREFRSSQEVLVNPTPTPRRPNAADGGPPRCVVDDDALP